MLNFESFFPMLYVTLMMGTLRKADCHGTTSLAMTDREINDMKHALKIYQ